MYNSAVDSILKDSIKSAIYIDEKAWEPYTEQPNTGDLEVEYSQQIYQRFKDMGISVAVRAFQSGDVSNQSQRNYFFEKRDLVLLDWKLAGDTGEEHALKLLSDLVKRPHIHFCSIYTSEPDVYSVFDNILAYFSGLCETDYDIIKLDITHIEEQLQSLFPIIKNLSYNRFNKQFVRDTIRELFSTQRELLKEVKEIINDNDLSCSLIKAMYALDKSLIKSDEPQSKPTLVAIDQKLIVINNTIITILNKEETAPESIINDFKNHIVGSRDSFVSMLGLEMQNIITQTNSLIDANDIGITRNALIAHRKQLTEGIPSELSTILYDETIKKILIQNIDLKLKYSSFKLLEKDVLDFIELESNAPTSSELTSLNVFYNSISIKNKKRIDFGDVFKKDEDYYLCINALCDCLRPEKNKWQFFFVKGKPIDIEDALRLGDTAFISFINNNLIVNWVPLEKHAQGNNDKEDIQILKGFKYKPAYIKPEQYLIESPDIADGKIKLWKAIQAKKDNLDIEETEIEYVTTIKENYTQRIANHAFTYPVRVGVDFVGH
ncbi:MAG: response regulator receiver domain [Paludibacter sp.]|nr:response regulator receiver domain [Paludibacter sp.]